MTLALTAVWMHFIGDFILQTDEMATKKSSHLSFLTIHIMYYMIPFVLMFGIKYAYLNGLLHFVVDFFSSKATRWAWANERRHDFFTLIGLDQALHLTCLLLTLPYAVPMWSLF